MSGTKVTTTRNDSEQKIVFDSCMELNRSISMFLATTKVLTYTALILLVSMTPDTVVDVLNLDSEEMLDDLGQIPESLTLLQIIVLLQSTAVSMSGIYGYASLKRHFVAFYGFALVLVVCWSVTFGIYVCLEDNVDPTIRNAFNKSKEEEKSSQITNILQAKFKCCGSDLHNYTSTDMPVSCCDTFNATSIQDISECLPHLIYEEQCIYHRASVYDVLTKSKNTFSFLISVGSAVALILALEIFLAFHMVRRLNEQLSEDIFRF